MRSERHIRALLLALAALIVPLSMAPAASAGTYTVLDCGESASIGNWVPSDSETAHLTVGNTCPAPRGTGREGLYMTPILEAATGAPNGASAAWTVAVPSGLAITGFSSPGMLLHSNGEAQWHPQLRTASGLLEETGAVRTFQGLATNKIELVVRCMVEVP
ncbi:MAG: hypothetical protein ACYDA6_03035, partial [Solirubrobacteraceae bacterium]